MKPYFVDRQKMPLLLRDFVRPSALLLGLVFAMPSMAADITASSSQNGGRHENGGYFEVGASGLVTNQVDVRATEHKDFQPTLLLSGVYQYKGLFVELVHLSQDGANLGYNFWNSEDWSVDFLAANVETTWLRDKDVNVSALNETQRNNYLLADESVFVGAGLRATRYWDDNYVFQFRIVSDYTDNLGLQSSIKLGKSWQVKNWNLYTLGSVSYLSSKLTNNIYGVSHEEATTQFEQYDAGAAFNYGLEFGAAYPITQNVVFRSTYRVTALSDEITDSPFSQADYSSLFNVSISYVF
ncbi:MipA/OmpV family protein [Vibrio neonatus]|uniref:MipA/OmpV family protein n=1 Tax=Vibrio neonatus TaxID=278860 RepID=UPI0021C36ACA|nr:MipA/OmpV family protein [Vibrio neonatus]